MDGTWTLHIQHQKMVVMKTPVPITMTYIVNFHFTDKLSYVILFWSYISYRNIWRYWWKALVFLPNHLVTIKKNPCRYTVKEISKKTNINILLPCKFGYQESTMDLLRQKIISQFLLHATFMHDQVTLPLIGAIHLQNDKVFILLTRASVLGIDISVFSHCFPVPLACTLTCWIVFFCLTSH